MKSTFTKQTTPMKIPQFSLIIAVLFALSIQFSQAKSIPFSNLDASKASYTLFSLTTGDTIPQNDSTGTNWDLAFKGTSIVLNSGIIGENTHKGQIVQQFFSDLITAPSSGFVEESEQTSVIPTGSGNGWYNYLGSPTHKIVPIENRVLVFQLSNGNFAKLEIISYYENNPDLSQYIAFPPSESAKFYTFNYFVQEDGSSHLNHHETIFSDLGASKNGYSFFNLSTCDTVPSSDSASNAWDIAFKGTSLLLNSGTSGPGATKGQLITQLFDHITVPPTDNYREDSELTKVIPTGSGNGWYNYTGSPTHKIIPITARTILIQTTAGDYFKLEIISYYKGNPDLEQYTAFPPSESNKVYTFRYQKLQLQNSIFSNEVIRNLEIYPNPNNGEKLTVDYLVNQSEDVSMSIVDMNGRQLIQQHTIASKGTQSIQFSLENLTPGTYLFVLRTSNSVSHQKLVVQH